MRPHCLFPESYTNDCPQTARVHMQSPEQNSAEKGLQPAPRGI